VADRFHLLANIGDALERVLARKHSVLKKAALTVDRLLRETEEARAVEDSSALSPSATEQPTQVRTTQREQLKQARRSRRLERYEAVIELHRQGLSLRAIGRQLGIGKNTVKRFIRVGRFPERAERAPRTMVTPFEPYLRERWTAGCHNAHTLWEEIRDLGFQGSASLVLRFVGRWRTGPGPSGKTPRWAQSAISYANRAQTPANQSAFAKTGKMVLAP
jgi:transposase